MKRILIVSDLQIPYHDKRAVANLIDFVKRYKPDQVVTIGDEIDMPTISRWKAGTAGAYTGTLAQDRDETVRILEALKVTDVIRSNHTDRLFTTIALKAPGLLGVPELELPNFLRFKELGIKYHRKPFEVAPGWVALHGDEGSTNSTPGLTALGLAKRHGKSVVCGHTHRLGLTHVTEASGGVLGRILTGFEVGNLMNFSSAHYLKAGSGNWQQGFGILYVDNKLVTPSMIPVHKNGSFVVEGKVYGN